VILEASYVRRPFRLAITQALQLPVAVEWIGWWLDTPVEQCLAWNQQRSHQLPEAVIRKHCAQLLQSAQVPQRQEGFALVVRLQSSQGVPLDSLISAALDRLEARLGRGANRDAAYRLHGYSRLLDLERLLYLIRLLSSHPKLTMTDGASDGVVDGAVDGELSRLLSPLPPGGLAEQAAALLGRLHGACYADPVAVAADLEWLDQQGFSHSWAGRERGELPPIEPPPWPEECGRPLSGLPRLGDRPVFVRTFSLLRHLLLHPHDLQAGERVAEHLCRSLSAGTNASPEETWTARKVHAALHETLVPYGFRLPGQSGRRGYALGTALLSLDDLREACALLELQAEQLGDGQAVAISSVLRQRLEGIGVQRGPTPRRRWITAAAPLPVAAATNGPGHGSAEGAPNARQIELIEAAIASRQRLLLSEHRVSRRRPAGEQNGWGTGARAQPLWPLQLVLYAGRWWLLVEHEAMGQPHGLLRCLELETVHVFQRERLRGRDGERHQQALERARMLEQRCGGLCFGHELAAQQALCHAAPAGDREWMETLRLRCSAAVMAPLRRELDRFAPAAVRLAAALPGDSWGRTERGYRGLVASGDPRHPYPVEIDLPRWVLDHDPELRRWLFAYGAAVRIEAPAALVAEHQRWLLLALQGYAQAGQQAGRLGEGTEPELNRSWIRKKAMGRPFMQPVNDPTV
jgi:hypothetical protein